MPLVLLGIGSWAALIAIGIALVAGGTRKPTPSVPPRVVSQAPTGVPLDPEQLGDVDAFLADVLGDTSC